MVSKQVSKTWSPGSNPGTSTNFMNMILENKPGLIVVNNEPIVTTKVKKYIEKNKLSDYSVTYLDPIPSDFKEVERGLTELKNNFLGIATQPRKEQEKPAGYEYEYRLNTNTILCAHNLDDFNRLKMWYGIQID